MSGLTPKQARAAYHAKPKHGPKVSSNPQAVATPKGTTGKLLPNPNMVSKLNGMKTGGARRKVHL